MVGAAPRRGAVRLAGSVSGEGGLFAPLSGRPCAFYFVTLREWDNGHTHKLFDVESHATFELKDHSGTAMVEPLGGDFRLGKHRLESGNSLTSWPQFVKVLERYGQSPYDDEGQERSVDWREWILVPGDRLEVAGLCGWEFAHPNGYRDRNQSLVVRSSPETQLRLRIA